MLAKRVFFFSFLEMAGGRIGGRSSWAGGEAAQAGHCGSGWQMANGKIRGTLTQERKKRGNSKLGEVEQRARSRWRSGIYDDKAVSKNQRRGLDGPCAMQIVFFGKEINQ